MQIKLYEIKECKNQDGSIYFESWCQYPFDIWCNGRITCIPVYANTISELKIKIIKLKNDIQKIKNKREECLKYNHLNKIDDFYYLLH